MLYGLRSRSQPAKTSQIDKKEDGSNDNNNNVSQKNFKKPYLFRNRENNNNNNSEQQQEQQAKYIPCGVIRPIPRKVAPAVTPARRQSIRSVDDILNSPDKPKEQPLEKVIGVTSKKIKKSDTNKENKAETRPQTRNKVKKIDDVKSDGKDGVCFVYICFDDRKHEKV